MSLSNITKRLLKDKTDSKTRVWFISPFGTLKQKVVKSSTYQQGLVLDFNRINEEDQKSLDFWNKFRGMRFNQCLVLNYNKSQVWQKDVYSQVIKPACVDLGTPVFLSIGDYTDELMMLVQDGIENLSQLTVLAIENKEFNEFIENAPKEVKND